MPLGANEPRVLDMRVIATSRSPLEAEVTAGRFRADLLYRLNVVSLQVPPLAARRADIPLLFTRLLAEAAQRHRVEPPDPSPGLLDALMARDWPGNVRELRNAAERFALGIGAGGERAGSDRQDAAPNAARRLADRVAGFERGEIIRALIAHGGALRPVYESLGLSRKTLYEKMQKHGIDKADYSDG